MERQLIGTIGLAVTISMVVAGILLPIRKEETVHILKNEYPARLVAAASDSVGENAFALGFTLTRACVELRVDYAFLYGYNISHPTAGSLDKILESAETMERLVPKYSRRISSGDTVYNGSEANYTLYDFRDYGLGRQGGTRSVFLIVERGWEVVACFSGVPDLFPERSSGSLIDAMVTRSGNRTYFSRRSLDEAGSLPIQDLPAGGLEFSDVERDETIEIAFRSDAFFTEAERPGAVQVIVIVCNGQEEALVLNFMD